MTSKCFISLNAGTIQEVRKEFNLDKPGIMEQNVDILYNWVQKQEHFVKKDFGKDYLERVIISTKGSVEKAKQRLDKLCTMRTLVPFLFELRHAKKDFTNLEDCYVNVTMPQITDDNYRIYIAKIHGKKLSSSIFRKGYQYSILLSEYLALHDYSRGCQVICDLRDANILDVVTSIDLVDLRNAMLLYTEGFGFRIASINILSNSTMIGAFVDILKQIVSAKIGQRISVCKSLEALHEKLSKKYLPEDYGGDQKSLSTLYKEWKEELTSDDNLAYLEEMKKARTDEKLRRSDKFNDEYLGMPGSFKKLCVD